RVRGTRRRLPRSRREGLPSAFGGGRVGREPRVAFVLGGGGVLGAHEVGMLRALREAGVIPDLVVGTSIGAVNGVFVAASPDTAVERLTGLWSDDSVREVFGARVWSRLWTLARSGTHLHSNEPLRRMLEELLPARTFEELAVPFQCVAAGIETAMAHWFTGGPLAPAVLASSAVPALLPPVRVGDRHDDVIRRYVARLYSGAQRRLGLRLSIAGAAAPGPARADRNGAGPDDSGPDDSGPDDSGPGEGDRPLIVLSRHAGPGDALILVHHLLTDHRRRPRVVMKAALQLDPCIDIVANRMPNAFVSPGGRAAEDIGRLAAGLGPRDALVLFPEGGNFTPERRRRAIRRLTRLRRAREAERAARMRNMMPPRPGGVLAALESAPTADV